MADQITPEQKRAIAAQVLTERADELAEMAGRMRAESPLVGAAASVVVDHLRGYIKYRLPFDFEESE
ncbi:hypothetical protein [Rhodococcus daqingensis]|uniref:Uncharacterized protein n=1 Tax=Rhodococcus daqingensis TaxID=2479363 RepID=A0ABW2S363_9NOCA